MSAASTPQPAVELRGVSKRFGPLAAVDDVTLTIGDGEFFSLLGPSGCGKTTALRMIAGFEHPSAGEVAIHGRVMGATPPYRRPVNTVFQSYALFPHMTVAENVAFGLKMKQVPRAEIARRVAEALRLVRLEQQADRRPKQLSGGQQQRVALARALVNEPEVLLLDEPLGALDLKLRKELQIELRALQERVGITFVYVTHDQEEALTMSDRIAVMSAGRLLQVGTPYEIYERPLCRFVAGFIGETNFLEGTLASVDGDHAWVRLSDGSLIEGRAPAGGASGAPVAVSVRPEKARLLHERPAGASSLEARVERVVFVGPDTRIVAALGAGQTVTILEQNSAPGQASRFAAGEMAYLSWSPESAPVLTE